MPTLFNAGKKIYCLDSNIFIEGWTKYYSPKLTTNYWELLDKQAKQGIIFAPMDVKRELEKKDDDLKKWTMSRGYFFKEADEMVTLKVAEILKAFPTLIDGIKGRSLADPWVIAHASIEKAVVVTKEELGTGKNIRIPNVCKFLGLDYMDDFALLNELGIQFQAVKL